MSPIRTTWHYERSWWDRGYVSIAGVDEVGMGCLAGPVIAGAVILQPNTRIDFIRDSKLLTAMMRETLAEKIRRTAVAWGIGEATPEEISALNLRNAGLLAMRRALEALSKTPDAVLVDAFHIPSIAQPQEAITKGDRKVRSIAAASIVAKVHRDALMTELDRQHPGYGFAVHKGYGTEEHRRALTTLGPSPIHRPSFAPVRALLDGNGAPLPHDDHSAMVPTL